MPNPDAPTRLPGETPDDHSATRPPLRTAATPEAIGPYRVLDVLGEGGFGVVYLAEQREPVRRRVALKVLKAGMDTEEVLARFDAERQALAMMDHPNIAKVFDAGVGPHGRPYFAMEFVQGEPITAYCDHVKATTRARLELLVQVCRAVQHAHQRGIIHRDLKPSNILVTLVDGKPVPKVIDFGIAKATTQRLTDSTLYTAMGRLMGTPEYMSPEQAGANSLDVDTRTDVYSLGVVLYELLTGALPFDPEALRRAGFAEIQRIIREVEPPSPSTRLSQLGIVTRGATTDIPAASAVEVAQARRTDPPSLRRQVRGELDWITMKALEKDRTRRYESASALAADLERYLTDEPVIAGPPSAWYRARKFAMRHRVGVGVGALFLVMLAGGLATTTWMYRRADAERRKAEAQRELATVQATRANEALQFVSGMFGAIDPDKARGRDVTVREVLDTATTQINNRLGSEPWVEASVRAIIGQAYFCVGKFGPARENLRKSLDLNTKVRGETDVETMTVMHNLAAALSSAGEHAESERVFTHAAELRSRTLGPDNPDTQASLSALVFVQTQLGKFEAAEQTVRGVIASIDRTQGRESKASLEARTSLCDTLNQLGKFAEAAQVGRETADIAERTTGPDSPTTLIAKSVLASSLGSLERDAEAETLIRQVMAGKTRVYGPDHAETLTTANLLGITLKNMGRLEEALPVAEDCLQRARASLGAEHPTTLIYMNNLGQLYKTMKRQDDAEKVFRESLAAQERVSGPTTDGTLTARVNLGLLLVDTGKTKEALAMLERALSGFESAYPAGHWKTAMTRVFVGQCLTDMGEYEEAESLLLQGYEEAAKALGPGNGYVKKAALSLADLYAAQGKSEQATSWREKAGPEKK